MKLNRNIHPTFRSAKKCICVELSSIDYQEAWELQTSLVTARRKGIIDADIFLFLEHPSVFTLGRRGGRENLVVSEAFLKESGITVIHVERGGNITFHGPGQLVVYPIIDLRAARLSVADYVTALEEVMIRSAADFGVRAERNPMNRGIWVGNNKLGSIGIAIRRGVTFHGLAFNVNISREPFGWINPCGLQGVGVTTLANELSPEVSMDQVRKTARRHMEAVFGIELLMTNLSELQDLLRRPAEEKNFEVVI